MIIIVAGDCNDTAAIQQNAILVGTDEMGDWVDANNASRVGVINNANHFIVGGPAAARKALGTKAFVSSRLSALMNKAKGGLQVFPKPPWLRWDDKIYEEKIIFTNWPTAAVFRRPANNQKVDRWGTREWKAIAQMLEEGSIEARAWTAGMDYHFLSNWPRTNSPNSIQRSANCL